jgi:hypothetical protein
MIVAIIVVIIVVIAAFTTQFLVVFVAKFWLGLKDASLNVRSEFVETIFSLTAPILAAILIVLTNATLWRSLQLAEGAKLKGLQVSVRHLARNFASRHLLLCLCTNIGSGDPLEHLTQTT